MTTDQPIYEIERANRAENMKSALAGVVLGGVLTAGALLLIGSSKNEKGDSSRGRQGQDSKPDASGRRAGR